MTEPHVMANMQKPKSALEKPYIKAAEAIAREFDYDVNDDEFYDPSYWRRIAGRALDAAFAELAANPPEGMVEAFNRGWMDGFKNYAIGPGADEAHVETLRRRDGLSAAFSALRKGDGDG